MRLKIHGGTPANDADNLCDSCRHSKIIRGRRIDEELVLCEASHLRTTKITFKVTSCSHYDDQQTPSYYELLQQAWILRPKGRKRPSGFVRASDLRDDEVEQLMAGVTEHEP